MHNSAVPEAYVAVFMPRKPDKPEKKPPVKNAIVTMNFELQRHTIIENNATKTINTIPITLYCCLR